MKNITRLLSPFFFILLLLHLSPSASQAGHVIGGSIGWECVGKDSFKIELTAYRDCNGSSLNSMIIGLSTNCGTKNIALRTTSTEDVTPVCDEQCTRCDSKGCTFKYGIQRIKASALVDVSSYRSNGCCELTAAFSQCCRSGFSSANFYIRSKINLCQSPCDNSPVFLSDPLSLICLGRDILYSQLAIDPDRDSLVYQLVPASASATNSISYNSPYAHDKPLYFLGFPKNTAAFPRGFHFDTDKGEVLFRPMKEEQGIIAMDVHSYRNGKRIGTVRREMIVIVLKCPDNNPPVLSGVSCSSPKPENFDIEVCPGEEICFKICTSDKDKDDTVTIAWNGGIPGASFTIDNKGSKRESGTFCWTPKDEHASVIPYRFTISASDNACPANGKTSRTYSILVKEPAPEATVSDLVGDCGNLELRALQTSGKPAASYNWLLDGKRIAHNGGTSDTLLHSTSVSGNFKYALEIAGRNGCVRTYTDSLIIPNHVTLLTNDTVVCANDSFTLKAKAHLPQSKYKIFWGTKDTAYNQLAVIKGVAGKKDSVIRVTVDDGFCVYEKDISVRANTAPVFSLSKDGRLCEERPLQLTAIPQIDTLDSDSIFQYRWYLSTNTKTLSRDSILSTSKSRTYIVEVSDSLGCTSTDTVRTYIDKAWVPKDTATCLGDNVFIELANSTPPSSYYWTDNSRDTSLISYTGSKRLLNPTNDRFYSLKRVYQINGASCTTYDSFKVVVHPLPKVTISPKTLWACPKQESISLEGSPANGSWTGPGISPTLTRVKLDIRTSPNGVYKYVYQYIDSNQCQSEDSSRINIRPTPVAAFSTSDTVIAVGEDVTFINNSGPPKHIKALWNVGNPTIASDSGDTVTIVFNNVGRYPVSLIVIDTLTMCADTLVKQNKVRVFNSVAGVEKSQVRVYPNPASNLVWIEMESDNHQGMLKLYDASGRKVTQQVLRKNKAPLNLENLSEGVYYWNLLMDGNTAIGKLVIQRP